MEAYKVFTRTQQQQYLGEELPLKYYITTGSWDDNPISASYSQTDLSSPSYWATTGTRNFDYMLAREQIRLISATDYDSFGEKNQHIACKLFLVPVESRSIHFSATTQRTHWNRFAKQMIDCRYQRWEDGRAYASYVLGINASTQMGIDTNDIAKEWKDYNTNKLFEWFEGTGSYSGRGYPSTNYYTASIGSNILETLRDGIRH